MLDLSSFNIFILAYKIHVHRSLAGSSPQKVRQNLFHDWRLSKSMMERT